MQNEEVFHQIEPYHSEESELSESESEHLVKRRQKRVWLFAKSFETVANANEWLAEEKIWSYLKEYDTDAGLKKEYRCNLVKRRGPQCAAGITLQFNSSDQSVTLLKTNKEHTHEEINIDVKTAINQVTKNSIQKLLDLRVTLPKNIISTLVEESKTDSAINVPTEQQIYNYLAAVRRRNGSSRMNYAQLSQWCKQHLEIPSDPNEPFVVSYLIRIDDEDQENHPAENKIEMDKLSFRLFITTRELLKIASKARVIQADSTYKLIWNNFPVMITGSSDKDKVFHPFGLAVVTTENQLDYQFMFQSTLIGIELINELPINEVSLLADAADAITNGFRNVFGTNFKRGMCWFHMRKAVNNRLSILNESKIQLDIMSDIDALQLSPTDLLFHSASKLFLKKWNGHSNSKMAEFLKYFEHEWLKNHFGWYEGYLLDGPRTNNGLESTNATIKKEYTFRKRLPLAEFLSTAITIVENWSQKRDVNLPNSKLFVSQPTVGTAEYTSAYQWLKSNKLTIMQHQDGLLNFNTNSGQVNEAVTNQTIKKYIAMLKSPAFKTFDEFYIIIFRTWQTTFKSDCTAETWLSSKCTCPAFFKNNICKHIIGLAATQKFLKIPIEAKQVAIGQKRKPGRLTKAKKALEKQPCDDQPTTSKSANINSQNACESRKNKRKEPETEPDIQPTLEQNKAAKRRPYTDVESEIVQTAAITQPLKRGRGRPKKNKI